MYSPGDVAVAPIKDFNYIYPSQTQNLFTWISSLSFRLFQTIQKVCSPESKLKMKPGKKQRISNGTHRKSPGTGDSNWYLVPLTIFVIAGFAWLLLYSAKPQEITGSTLIGFNVIALIAGTVCEYWRLCASWTKVIFTLLGSLALSWVAFLPGRSERFYNIDDHIRMWPYVFLVIFIIIVLSTHKEEATAKLTEGVTLLQSLGLIYLIIETGWFAKDRTSLILLAPVLTIFIMLSFVHAFTLIKLTKSHRLTLSIWSSIIMVVLALVNIITIYRLGDIQEKNEIYDDAAIGIQYFLLGVSAIYMVQNLLMVLGFLPGRQTFFNEQYYRELKELKHDHIKRYSDKQVHPLHSVIALVICGLVFTGNFYFHWLPALTCVWFMILFFPILLSKIAGPEGT